MEQPPQLRLLVWRSKHELPHCVSPGLQTHILFEHIMLAPHLMPQPPQLLTSLVTGMQVPLQ
jgi:hypothetical protein